MKQEIIISIIGIFFVTALVFFYSSQYNNKQAKIVANSTNTKKTQNVLPTENNSPTNLTSEEVAKHNQASDCWFIIKNKVYDVTQYTNIHPGGKGLIAYCGQDATTPFVTKDGQGKHSPSAYQDLQLLYIGDINGQINQQLINDSKNNISKLPKRKFKEEDDD